MPSPVIHNPYRLPGSRVAQAPVSDLRAALKASVILSSGPGVLKEEAESSSAKCLEPGFSALVEANLLAHAGDVLKGNWLPRRDLTSLVASRAPAMFEARGDDWREAPVVAVTVVALRLEFSNVLECGWCLPSGVSVAGGSWRCSTGLYPGLRAVCHFSHRVDPLC